MPSFATTVMMKLVERYFDDIVDLNYFFVSPTDEPNDEFVGVQVQDKILFIISHHSLIHGWMVARYYLFYSTGRSFFNVYKSMIDETSTLLKDYRKINWYVITHKIELQLFK